MILNENQIEMYENCIFLNEGFINQAFMGLRIHPHQNIDETFKKHKYEGYLNLINRTKKLDDLIYIRKDIYLGLSTFKKVGDRIEKCSKLGECDETKNYYKGIKKKYLDKGITYKDVELTIKWFKEVALKTLNEKIKKAKSSAK